LTRFEGLGEGVPVKKYGSELGEDGGKKGHETGSLRKGGRKRGFGNSSARRRCESKQNPKKRRGTGKTHRGAKTLSRGGGGDWSKVKMKGGQNRWGPTSWNQGCGGATETGKTRAKQGSKQNTKRGRERGKKREGGLTSSKKDSFHNTGKK